MLRKTRAAGLALAVAAAVLLPSSPAFAAIYKGNYSGCYSIKKKGNYNDIRVGSVGVVDNGKVAGYGSLKLTAGCQKLNSLPVTNFHIYGVTISVNGHPVATSGSADAHHRKSAIHQQTRAIPVKCGKTLQVAVRVSYRYYDGAIVRPFTVKGHTFKRC
jgi:type IV secretory pathway protease TraF